MILISDVQCFDCRGEVTMYGAPDKVWNGLGLTDEWLCLDCLARRLNPSHVIATTKELNDEIWKQRERFGLKRVNEYLGAPMEDFRVAIAQGKDFSSCTAAQVGGRQTGVGKFNESDS